MSRKIFVASLVILFFVIGVSQAALAQTAPPASPVVLNILNEDPEPMTVEIEVVQGDPVEVAFEVNPEITSNSLDRIQLLQTADNSVVSEVERGDDLSGTVFLDTSSDAALGELRGVYRSYETGNVLATADQTVLVVEGGAPGTVYVPSGGSIQSAIDAVGSGGIIYLEPGIFTGPLVVANKQVHIIGNRAFGRRRTVIVSLNPEQPVITFGPRGGGSIRSSTIRGLGADGIRGIAEDGVRPASIQVNLTRILDTRQGISGSFSDLTVKMSIIRNTVINAIELWQVDNLDLLNTLVTNVDEFGLVVFNLVGTGTIHINNCTFLRASLGGIAIVGGAKPVYISNCTIGRCRAAGISLWETGFVRVLSTRVYLTQYGMIWPYDRLADGLIAASSANVLVQDSLFQYNARAGVIYESSGGGIQWTQSEGGRFGLVVQGQPKPTYLGYNNLFVGTEEDILTDGALSVPAAPPLPPQP